MIKNFFPMILVVMSFFHVNHLFADWGTATELGKIHTTLRGLERNSEDFKRELIKNNRSLEAILFYRKLQFLIEFKEMCQRCGGNEDCSELCKKFMDKVNEVLEQRLEEILS